MDSNDKQKKYIKKLVQKAKETYEASEDKLYLVIDILLYIVILVAT